MLVRVLEQTPPPPAAWPSVVHGRDQPQTSGSTPPGLFHPSRRAAPERTTCQHLRLSLAQKHPSSSKRQGPEGRATDRFARLSLLHAARPPSLGCSILSYYLIEQVYKRCLRRQETLASVPLHYSFCLGYLYWVRCWGLTFPSRQQSQVLI